MRELQAGLWHWQAPHRVGAERAVDQKVSSYAIDDGERLVLFDPIAPPSEIEKLAAERETAIVLTAPWHERDAQGLVERLGVPVYTPLPDTAEDLMRTYGITAEQAGTGAQTSSGSSRRGWRGAPYAAGDRLDVGVEASPGQKPNDLVLWVESHRAVIAGDTLVDSDRPRGQFPVAASGHDARAGRRTPASAARAACRARAPGARSADRPCCARTRALVNAASAPLDAATIERIRASFARQGAMATLGADLADVARGRVAIAVPIEPRLSQQDGFLRRVVAAALDSACG